MKNTKKGFTIIELVIVIAVIGILAGVLIPTFSTVIANANKSSATQAVAGAKNILANDNGLYTVPEDTIFLYGSIAKDANLSNYELSYAFREVDGKEEMLEVDETKTIATYAKERDKHKIVSVIINSDLLLTDNAINSDKETALVAFLNNYLGLTAAGNGVTRKLNVISGGYELVDTSGTGENASITKLDVNIYTSSVAKEVITLVASTKTADVNA